MLDHLHRMNWGGKATDQTAHMAEGIVRLKGIAKERDIRLLCAAQLTRASGQDILEDYMPPSLSSIKQTGATEQEADSVLFLHRTLKPGLTEGDRRMVQQGLLPVADVADNGTMSVRIGKLRLDGDVRDHTVHLYVAGGRLFNDRMDRDEYSYTSGRA